MKKSKCLEGQTATALRQVDADAPSEKARSNDFVNVFQR